MAKVNTLSQGMKQMIQFVVAIIHRPRLLILDEPFAGLDPLNVGADEAKYCANVSRTGRR